MVTGRTLRLTLALALMSAAPALAVERHASPTGSGSACTSAAPCTFAQAVSGAVAGDEVVVASGTHTVGASVIVNAMNLTVRGPAAGPRPLLQWSTASAGLGLNVPASIRDLTFRGATTGITGLVRSSGGGSAGTVLDRVVIDQTGTGYGMVTANWTVQNSAIRSAGHGAIASGTMTGTTILAPGTDQWALRASSGFGDVVTSLVVRNSILRGGSGLGGRDIVLDNAGTPGRTTTVDVDSSNYDPARTTSTGAGTLNLIQGPNNVSAAPVFAAAGTDDFARQAATSPTIDRGSATAAQGTGDVDGDARQVGMVDIGADEFVPAPTAGAIGVSAVGPNAATLSATFNTFTRAGTARFEYGITTAYGSVSADQAVSGASAVSATLGGLAPSTTYHARLVVATDRGTAIGPDVAFTTAAPPPPPLLPVALGRLTVAPATLRSGRVANVRFSLSRTSQVTFRIERLASGRLRSGTCKLTARTGKACTKWVLRGQLSRSVAGASVASMRIPAKVGSRVLAPGRYRLTVTAKAADGVASITPRLIVTVK